MLNTNLSSLVKISVMGEVANPSMPGLPASPYMVTADGEPVLIPAYGGLVYNVRIGDRAMGWAAELIQPGRLHQKQQCQCQHGARRLCLHRQPCPCHERDGRRCNGHSHRQERSFCRTCDLRLCARYSGEDGPGRSGPDSGVWRGAADHRCARYCTEELLTRIAGRTQP